MFILEGNIGAGKSTFISMLRERVSFLETALEPVNCWDTPCAGESILGNFIVNPRRWSFTIEVCAMVNRVREHLVYQQTKSPLFLLERSVYSGHYVFAVNGYQQGFMTPAEWHAYQNVAEFLLPQCRAPRGFIYLRAEPAVAMKRIEKRNRSSESSITTEYINQVHERHEEFLIEKKGIACEVAQVPVLILDCSREFEQDPDYSQVLIDQVTEFVLTYAECEKVSEHYSVSNGLRA